MRYIFADFIFEGNKLERLPNRGPAESILGLEISLKELLIHIQVQFVTHV
jgi:hypothetical protein